MPKARFYFFCTIRRPPPSPLFPYTTLFRSMARTRRHQREIAFRARHRFDGSLRAEMRQDRKSTRLNSSHVKNSYAVFCLKKKKMFEQRAKMLAENAKRTLEEYKHAKEVFTN